MEEEGDGEGEEGVYRSNRVDGEESGEVNVLANAPHIQPPQDQPNLIPVVAAVDLARRHAIARAYAFGLPSIC